MKSGHYNNTLKNVIGNKAGEAAELAWLSKNKLNSDSFDFGALYNISTLLTKPTFAAFLQSAYLKKIKLGAAWSGDSEVNGVIAFNTGKSDAGKIQFLVSEIEDYTTTTPAQFKTLLVNNYIKAKAHGIPFGVYEGWSKQYDMIVQNSDFLFLHCYRTPVQIARPDDAFNYCSGRLAAYAASAAAAGKIYPVSIIYSSEPAFGQSYFTANSFQSAHDLFLKSYAKNATASMKRWLIIDGQQVFVTSYSQKCKP